jgi:hypothetical protein
MLKEVLGVSGMGVEYTRQGLARQKVTYFHAKILCVGQHLSLLEIMVVSKSYFAYTEMGKLILGIGFNISHPTCADQEEINDAKNLQACTGPHPFGDAYSAINRATQGRSGFQSDSPRCESCNYSLTSLRENQFGSSIAW